MSLIKYTSRLTRHYYHVSKIIYVTISDECVLCFIFFTLLIKHAVLI